MSGFTDKLAIGDGVTIALNCGKCNQPATDPHACIRRMFRENSIVLVQQIDPASNAPDDLFRVQVEKTNEQYTITRAMLDGNYSDIY